MMTAMLGPLGPDSSFRENTTWAYVITFDPKQSRGTTQSLSDVARVLSGPSLRGEVVPTGGEQAPTPVNVGHVALPDLARIQSEKVASLCQPQLHSCATTRLD